MAQRVRGILSERGNAAEVEHLQRRGKRPTRRVPYDQLAVPRRGAGVAEQGCLLSSFTPKG